MKQEQSHEQWAIACLKATVYGLDWLPATRPLSSTTDSVINGVLEVVGKGPLTHSTIDPIFYMFLLYGMIQLIVECQDLMANVGML